jgi:hypothetical protein
MPNWHRRSVQSRTELLVAAVTMGGRICGNYSDPICSERFIAFRDIRHPEDAMYTAAECRGRAKKMRVEAGQNARHRRRLNTAAEGWLLLARRLSPIEKAYRRLPLKETLDD